MCLILEISPKAWQINMKYTYFSNIATIEELKKQYHILALKFHPDRGGSTEIMQEINNEYSEFIKNPTFVTEPDYSVEEMQLYSEIIYAISNFNLIVELVGKWLWVSGLTFNYKDHLRQLGFHWAPVKMMWYYRYDEYRCPSWKQKKSYEEIKEKWGCTSDFVKDSP